MATLQSSSTLDETENDIDMQMESDDFDDYTAGSSFMAQSVSNLETEVQSVKGEVQHLHGKVNGIESQLNNTHATNNTSQSESKESAPEIQPTSEYKTSTTTYPLAEFM